MDTLFRLTKQLGCSRGCGEGRREIEAFRLKESIMKTLRLLFESSESHFVDYCEILVTSHPIQDIMDIFHAFFGFCSETIPNNAQSSSTHLTTNLSVNKKSNFKNGYYNNFGIGFPSTTTSKSIPSKVFDSDRNIKIFLLFFFIPFQILNLVKLEVDAIIVKASFKPLINRLVLIQRELKVQENMSLYCEIRQFISYVRDHHGGIFRNVRIFQYDFYIWMKKMN